MNWLAKNVEWVFSGIGVAVIGWLFFRSRQGQQTHQHVKNSSNVTQVGGNVTIGKDHDESDSK